MKKDYIQKFINKEKMQYLSIKMPYIFILLLMVAISPLGIYLFVFRINNKKTNMYNRGRNLIGAATFVLFLVFVGIYTKIKEIVQLYDSGMSLDMINFLPDNLLLYTIGIVMIISYMYGGRKLIKRSKIEQIYTYRINIEHKESLKELSNELNISIKEVIENIKLLQKSGHLVQIEIDNKKDRIIYNDVKTSKTLLTKEHKNKKATCSKCGTLVTFKVDEYVECDFCGHGMIDEEIK